MISIDFETRSKTNLLTDGVYNYASCPSTEIICMAYSVDGVAPELWLPGDLVPAVFASQTHDHYYAWNAAFERLIWDIMVCDHDFPEIPLEQWYCSAYASRCSNMPAALGNAARCLNVEQQKSDRGHALIKLLCIPLADGTFCKDPKLLEEMYDYCLQDVRAEQSTLNQVRAPTDDEWEDYFTNERINDRGVRIDRALAAGAQDYAEEEVEDLVAQIEYLTDGAVVKARGEKLKDWVVERLTEEQQKLLVKHRGGEKMLSLDKYNRARLLALDDIDPTVAEVIECSDFAQRSSVGKFNNMLLRADPQDDRVRGAFMANGAAASGRYSSRGLQVHNFPRDSMADPEAVRQDIIDTIVHDDMVDFFGANIMTILSHMLRPALIPAPSKKFLAADWSAIEGRVAPWLCNDSEGEKKLQLYRHGEPIYEIAAGRIYYKGVEDVTSDERQVGKVAELSLQFGGGENAFLGMARNYGVRMSVVAAKNVKLAWRAANPWAQHIWADCERAIMLAIRKPTQTYKAGRMVYFTVPDILCGGLTLFCQLPCGRLLTYPDTRIEVVDSEYGTRNQITYLRSAFLPKATEKAWPRSSLWGGLAFQNAVQATAASLLRGALRQCDAAGLPVILHVHDEIVVESTPAQLGQHRERLAGIMNNGPEWAAGLPLQAEVKTLDRFGK